MSDDIILIDSNVLVYAFDTAYREKRQRAKEIVEAVTNGEMGGAVSNQILAEFFTCVTDKIEKPLSIDDAQTIVEGMIASANWIKADYTSETVNRAVTLCKEHTINLWDALVIATMREHNIFRIYTEDIILLRYAGIRAENPFVQS